MQSIHFVMKITLVVAQGKTYSLVHDILKRFVFIVATKTTARKYSQRTLR